MAEDNIGKGVSKFVADIKRGLEGKYKDKIAEIAAKTGAVLIRERTRKGFGVANDGGAPYRLKRLSPSYVEFRRTQTLSPFTSASMSNLTFTGAMLESLSATRVKTGVWQITLKGTNPRSGLSNAQIARYVSRSRPFLHLSGGEIEEIRDAARDYFDLVKSKLRR